MVVTVLLSASGRRSMSCVGEPGHLALRRPDLDPGRVRRRRAHRLSKLVPTAPPSLRAALPPALIAGAWHRPADQPVRRACAMAGRRPDRPWRHRDGVRRAHLAELQLPDPALWRGVGAPAARHGARQAERRRRSSSRAGLSRSGGRNAPWPTRQAGSCGTAGRPQAPRTGGSATGR